LPQQGTDSWLPTVIGYRCSRKGSKPNTIIDGIPLGCFCSNYCGGRDSGSVIHTLGSTTIRNVAMGPRNNEISHQSKPLRPLDCAKPALMKLRVPKPTKNCADSCMVFLSENLPYSIICCREAFLEK
jgi:hypothetical protein